MPIDAGGLAQRCVNNDQLLRYSRHILLPEIDLEGQERLLAATVLIVGLGGLGSAVSLYLAAAGIGHLVLADPDRVDLANLQRQVLYDTGDLGRDKVEVAVERLARLNPDCRITPLLRRLADSDLDILARRRCDIVVDASDNFDTRYAINRACLFAGKPLVSGAAVRFEGQVLVLRPGRGACYACLYPEIADLPERCTDTGVAAPLVGIIGSVQAMEVLKLLTGAGQTLEGRLLRLDALRMVWQGARIARDPGCVVCGEGVARLDRTVSPPTPPQCA
jgi:molybdopterin-synthase adenylyltransferase